MKLIRWILGRIILVVDALASPKPIARNPSVQKEIDQMTASMSMYQFNTCPFCVKVRRELKRHSLNIELRDAKNDAEIKAELVREGGRHMVPVNNRAVGSIVLGALAFKICVIPLYAGEDALMII